MKAQLLLEAALFGALASGLAFNAPEATAVGGLGKEVDLVPHPMQTMAPDIGRAELLKRDFQLTYLVGPDNTCGYFSGLSTSSYYCGGTGYTCDLILSLYTSAGAPVGGIACCNSASCVARTTCIDSKAYAAGARCTSFCVACTDSLRPYCGGVTISHLNVRDLFCDTTTTNVFQAIDTTYNNQLQNRIFKTTSITITESSSSSLGSTAAASTASAGTGQTTAAGGVTSPAGSSGPTTPAQQDNSGPPIGPIVGGVVGGVAVLAGIAAAVFFIMRKKRRAAQNAQQQPQPPFNPQQNQMPPMNQYQQGPGGPGTMGAAMGGAAAGAAWGHGKQGIVEAPGSPPVQPEKAAYYGPPLHEAPGSVPTSAGSPPSGYGSPQSGYVPPYNPDGSPYNYNQNAPQYNSNRNSVPYNYNPDVINQHGQGSPGNPPPAQLSGSDVYPHHTTIHEIGG